MTDQQKLEIIKSIAYGESDTEAADANGVSISEVSEIRAQQAEEITEKRKELEECGYVERN